MVNSKLDDRELLKSFRLGDEQSFAIFYRRHEESLYFYFCSIIGVTEESQDLIQELVLKIIDNLDQFIEANDLRTYLFRCAHNIALTSFTRKSRYSEALNRAFDEKSLFSPRQTSKYFSDQESPKELSQALFSLPMEQREVIVLHLYENFTFKKIAELSNVSSKTLFSRYTKGIENLKLKLKDYIK